MGAGDVGYVRYFTAFIYEFQFYRALCLESGRYVPGDPKKPLHRCNFYGSREAGEKLCGGEAVPDPKASSAPEPEPEPETGSGRRAGSVGVLVGLLAVILIWS